MGNPFASHLIQNPSEIEASHTTSFAVVFFFAPIFISGWLALLTRLFQSRALPAQHQLFIVHYSLFIDKAGHPPRSVREAELIIQSF